MERRTFDENKCFELVSLLNYFAQRVPLAGQKVLVSSGVQKHLALLAPPCDGHVDETGSTHGWINVQW